MGTKGTKPMVFPLDGSGRLYVLHDENDDQVCMGSRETCYRLLEMMNKTRRRNALQDSGTEDSAELYDHSALYRTAESNH
ncbi:MAG TPA: hypothetical protein VF723_04415 [Pyrinomonadaceae bacterium]|jgi:hypothetical protein